MRVKAVLLPYVLNIPSGARERYRSPLNAAEMLYVPVRISLENGVNSRRVGFSRPLEQEKT
jgi:hypothetical protein